MRFAIAFAATLVALPAAASGGLSCQAEDDRVRLTVESGMTRGMGAPLFNFRGRLDVVNGEVRDVLRSTRFEREHVPQYWLDADGLKLRLYRETESGPHAYVEAAIIAGFDAETEELNGEYSIVIYDVGEDDAAEARTVELSGPVSCFVE